MDAPLTDILGHQYVGKALPVKQKPHSTMRPTQSIDLQTICSKCSALPRHALYHSISMHGTNHASPIALYERQHRLT